MQQHMLTTIDNPYNPFTEIDEWIQWDQAAGYNTMNYLARIVKTSDDLSEVDEDLAYEQAIEEIIEYNINGMYKRVPAPEGWEE